MIRWLCMVTCWFVGFLPAAEPLQTFAGCKLVAEEWSDGDSFPVLFPDGKTITVRLYGVDCMEMHVQGNESNARRLRDQRRHFGITDITTAREVGVEAKKEADLHPWPAPFDQPFYLVMNVAVGGNFPGAPNDQTRFPAELVVDYVRVYDKVGGYGPVKPRGPGVMPWQKGHVNERRN